MHDELLRFKLQQVWTLVDLSNGKRAIRTKWIYKNKKDKRDIMVRNKERLVAQGYTQEEGIDYNEVFALAARIKAIRLFLACASFKDFVVYQMDVKSAFLYGKIEVEVYVCQPLGFEDPKFLDRVYKVEKALYGLHQALRACQDKYVNVILKKFGFSIMKTASTPMETSKPLMNDENAKDVDVQLYRSMIGSLMYLTSLSPDIMFDDSPIDLEAYTDSDYAGASLDKKFTTGDYQFLRSRMILWQCKKQTIVANSNTKAEYVAVANCCRQIINFLSANPIKYALTVNPTIYTSYIEQFWATATAKNINREAHIHANVDGKKVIILEATIRRDLKFEYEGGVDCLSNEVIFEQLLLMGVESSVEEQSLNEEDASKQGRNIADINADADTILVDETTEDQGSSKRASDKLDQGRSKKQKVEDDKDQEELKRCLEIIPDDGDDVTIDATPLSIKTLILITRIYKL
nr:retrotransposon protein, putative, unclassified [Tanacetum cinerariifolium]